MGIYDPLEHYLKSLKRDAWLAEFAEIEAILGCPLPPSARRHTGWWSNHPSHSLAHAWLRAGWRTDAVDVRGQRVAFLRRDNRSDRSIGFQPYRQSYPLEPVEPHNWDKPERLECSLEMVWRPLGRVSLETFGKLCFPPAASVAALYRFKVGGQGGAVYVGETENLARQFEGYRNPQPRQETNHKINGLLTTILRRGAQVSVAAVTSEAWMQTNLGRARANLAVKSIRRMFENLAISAEGASEIGSLREP
jgi:hypothetical protein